MAKLDKFPESIKRFKDIHKDQDCIIMGSGPSLKDIPHSFLSRFNVIGANASWRYYKPNYLTTIDVQFSWFRPTREFAKENNIPYFICWQWEPKEEEDPDWKRYKAIDYPNEVSVPFDDSITPIQAYDNPGLIEARGFNSSITVVAEAALPLALYMGHKRIYLAGVDFGEMNHFYEDDKGDVEKFKAWKERAGGLWDVKIHAMEDVAKSSIKNRVFNLSPNSKIQGIQKIDWRDT